MADFYGIILLYPIISVIILKFLGADENLPNQILGEYYLLLGYTIAYIAVIFIFMFGVNWEMDYVVAFILYTIGYFVVSILRKTLYTGTTEGEAPSSSR